MSLLDTIESLEMAGVDPAKIVDVLKTKEEKRLSSLRERVSRCRAKAKARSLNNNDSCNVTSVTSVTHVTDDETKKVSPTPPSKKLPPISKKNPPKGGQKESSSPRQRKTRIPDDWYPPPEGLANARSKGMTPETIQNEIEGFKNHAEQSNRKLINWNAGWASWCNSWVRYGKKQAGGSVQRERATFADIIKDEYQKREYDVGGFGDELCDNGPVIEGRLIEGH